MHSILPPFGFQSLLVGEAQPLKAEESAWEMAEKDSLPHPRARAGTRVGRLPGRSLRYGSR